MKPRRRRANIRSRASSGSPPTTTTRSRTSSKAATRAGSCFRAGPERSGRRENLDRAVEADIRHTWDARALGGCGKASSHGCVRLTNWDAEDLAGMAKPGTVVRFVDWRQPRHWLRERGGRRERDLHSARNRRLLWTCCLHADVWK
ncbi:L,D-transpeptidase [Bosea thiooxidans]